jgi:hypothetical protein
MVVSEDDADCRLRRGLLIEFGAGGRKMQIAWDSSRLLQL